MHQYMFDTNIFNRILDEGINMSYLPKAQYYITHLQYDEVEKTGDETRRRDLLGILQTVSNKKYPTKSGVFDVSRFDEAFFSEREESAIKPTTSAVYGISKYGLAKYGSGSLYETILDKLNEVKPKEKENNIKDALIAETSIKNGFFLVTNDDALHKIVRNLGCKVLNWEEFLSIGG